jgi:hypothetical protein
VSHTVTVTLEVDPTSDPIQGIARDEQGAERPFTGWIGLATALELALEVRGGADRAPDNQREARP